MTTITVPELDAVLEACRVKEFSEREDAILLGYYQEFSRYRRLNELADYLGKPVPVVKARATQLGLRS